MEPLPRVDVAASVFEVWNCYRQVASPSLVTIPVTSGEVRKEFIIEGQMLDIEQTGEMQVGEVEFLNGGKWYLKNLRLDHRQDRAPWIVALWPTSLEPDAESSVFMRLGVIDFGDRYLSVIIFSTETYLSLNNFLKEKWAAFEKLSAIMTEREEQAAGSWEFLQTPIEA